MKFNLMKTFMASIAILSTNFAIAANLGDRFMNQPAYAGAGVVFPLGSSHQDYTAFFNQDFQKMSIEQKEFVAFNMLRELAFFNIGTNDKINKMTDVEKEIFINRAITDPIHPRVRSAIKGAVKQIISSTDFTLDKNPQSVANLKKYLVKIDLLSSDDKQFNFLNDYRYNRFEEVFDSKDLNKIWADLFSSKYGSEITPQGYIVFDAFEGKYNQEQINSMFDQMKVKY